MIDLLISIFDGHNEASILLTEEYKPKKILFFYLTNKDAYQLTKFKEYYKNKFPDVEFYYENFNIDNPREVEDIIIKYKANKNILNVTSGKKVALLMIYSLALKNSIECKYIDIEKELIIDFSDKAININKSSFVDLNIDDIVKSVGGSIIVDSTEVYNREAIINITYWIANNLEIWEEVKSDLQMNNVFIRDECNPEIMKIDKNILSKNKMEFYYRGIKFLKEFRNDSL